MRISPAFLGWGLFFILVGAIPLAVDGGAVTRDQVVDWWRFWPLIFIGIGLGLVLRRTRLEGLGGLLIAATSGVMVGGLLAAGVTGFPGEFCGQADRAVSFPAQSGALFGDSEVELTLDCGDVTVTTQPGPGWSVEGEDRTPGGPEIRSDEALLVVRSANGERGPLDFIGRHTTWRVGLPTDPRLGLHAVINAGSATFDLAGANLDVVDVEMNAGSATVDLGDTRVVGEIRIQMNAGSLGLTLPSTSTHGSIEANAGSVDLCVPTGVALRLQTNDSAISSFDYDGHGLVQSGDTWSSPDFDTAAQRIDLVTEGNAGSFTLNPEEGCRG
jgi:LiaF transmembrane domain